jgi:cytochrome c oxidase cbb3-type subunit 2
MRSSDRCAIALAMFAAASIASHAAFAESDTGTIRGRVSYEGPHPNAEAYEIQIDRGVCGATQPIRSEDFVVSQKGDLANVAVFLVASPPTVFPPAGKSAAVLKQENCVFSPHVQTVSAGAELTIGNSDAVIHNVHATSEDRTVFNLAMPLKDVEVKRELTDPGILSLRCDSGHTWMKAFIVVVDHSFHATSDRSGAFEIRDVPFGTYTVRGWHERLGVIEQRVTVSGGESTVELAYAKDTPLVDGAEARRAVPDPRSSMAPTAAASGDVRPLREALKLERRSEIRQRGRPLFQRHCAPCHGDKGDGRGEQAPFCDSRPRDFTRGEYKFRSTPSGSLARIDDLERTIAQGLRGTSMMGWSRTLSKDDLRLLAEYLTTFSIRYLKDDPPPPMQMMPEPKTDAESIARGRAIYKKLKCAQCHGETGRGDGVSNTVADVTARASDIASGRFKGGLGAPAIYRAVTTGLSGSSMPSFSQLATPAELWDLAHYIDSLKKPKSVFEWLFGDPAGRKAM